MRKFYKADSNRGGALLSVIIAMTVVGILGALVLSISYTNFRMKQIDKHSTDNFYSAEGVLDEICAGLQEEVSAQYKKAYTTVMENYGTYDSSEAMGEDFNTEFVLNMVGVLQNAIGDSDHYKIAQMNSYVNPSNYPSGHTFSISSVVTGSSTDPTTNVTTYTYDNKLETLEDGLAIRNLVVTYQDGGYVNTITTDIKISTPALEFARISTMPEIADYSIIAQDGLDVASGAHWSLQGKAFAGTGINLTSAELDANNAATTLLVTQGDVTVQGGSVFTTSTTTSLWANAVTAGANTGSTTGGNTISLLGRSYIKDDTTLNGASNVLTVGGQYYGYSNNDSNATESSAIIINGSDSTLNMSNLETLVVAGTSFVSTKYTGTDTTTSESAINTADVLMGDSIAVKGNQIAYMVPTECKGIVSNPMSYSQYADLITNSNWKEDALSTYLSTLRRSLASYGSISIQPVYTARDGGTVYLYLSFTDADVASKYYMDYYGGYGGVKMREYLNRYVSAFSFNTTSMNRLVAQGNYLVPASSTATTGTYTGNTGDVATTAQELQNYSSSYTALCAKLVENKSSLSSTELDQTVYQNLIDSNASGTGKLDKFLAACKNNSANLWSDNISYTTTGNMEVATIWASAADMSAGTGVRCIIVDNDDDTDTAYTVPSGGSGIIIATGDVALNSNVNVAWDGLIICNGEITLSGGSDTNETVLKADANATAKAMQFICSVGASTVSEETPDCNYSVMNFFIGGGEFSVGASSSADGAKVDVRDCLSYENWKSE